MAWIAKPNGAYGIDSDEAKNNMFEIYNILCDSFTIEAICGILGNMNGESGYNPWRWQGDTYNVHNGYGLVQFTPGRTYWKNGRKHIGYASDNI